LGQGFKLSPAMGGIAAGLALQGRTSQSIDFITTNSRTAA
jgi:sarcosine oxidase